VRSIVAGRAGAVRPSRVLYAAAALSLLAALIHLWVTPEHFGEWWGYGAFFLAAALAQVLYAPLVLVRPTRMALLLGIGGHRPSSNANFGEPLTHEVPRTHLWAAS
jgi:hypothetical protein